MSGNPTLILCIQIPVTMSILFNVPTKASVFVLFTYVSQAPTTVSGKWWVLSINRWRHLAQHILVTRILK